MSPVSPPTHEIAPGYHPEAELSPGSFRCVDSDGRRWVLKPLPADCLHHNALHPAIRDRLARVRELPHARCATLAGVVRGVDAVYLVWSFVDGRPLNAADLSAERFTAVAHALASAVEMLHARGMVHGGLHGGNVIVTAAGDVWLTHLSPYLWDDPAEDVLAVLGTMRLLAAKLSLNTPDVDDAPPQPALRDLANRWSSLVETGAAAGKAGWHRRRSLLAAACVTFAAAAAAVAIAARAGRSTAPSAAAGMPQLVAPAR